MARGTDVNCLRHGKPAKRHRLRYPLPDSTPAVMRWEPPGPGLWLCSECFEEAKAWAEEDPNG